MLGQPGRDLLHIFNQHLNFRVMGKEMTLERKGKKWKEKKTERKRKKEIYCRQGEE